MGAKGLDIHDVMEDMEPTGTPNFLYTGLAAAFSSNEATTCMWDAFTWWSGLLLHMACTSPVRFNWLLCNMTQIN
jgi:hypothetical protein